MKYEQWILRREGRAAGRPLLESAGLPALCAAVIMGSSDTLAYVTAVYFSSVGVRRTRHTYPAAVLVMILCIFLSCLLVRSFFAECGS